MINSSTSLPLPDCHSDTDRPDAQPHSPEAGAPRLTQPLRFVILHHTGHGDEHWDLMLEYADSLLTWQLEREPPSLAALPIPAKRIGNHRKLYLDYEGPVSGGRGTVRRVDDGSLVWLSIEPSRFEFVLHGKRLTGRFALTVLPQTPLPNGGRGQRKGIVQCTVNPKNVHWVLAVTGSAKSPA